MSEGAIRAIIGIAALLVGFAAGFMLTGGGRGRSGPDAIGLRQVVVVGPTAADVHPPRVPLSKQNRDEIVWIATSPGKDLVIESVQQLFEQQTQQGNGRWAMTCSGRQCESKAIRSATALGQYKYWQIFRQGGQTVDEADGWIIIDR